MNIYKILIVEDDSDFAYLIEQTLHTQSDFECVGVASTPKQALEMTSSLKPDLVLVDLSLTSSELDGINTAKEIRLHSSAKIVFLTVCEDTKIMLHACETAFASGYIFKRQYKLIIETVHCVLDGSTPQTELIKSHILGKLTSAETFLFDYLLNNGAKPQSSSKTIANQKTSILHKLNLHSTKELLHLFQNY